MEEIITFDPSSEFQVLETFDFEEETQRPQNARFFTLEEQLNDYFELSAPKGKVTRFDMEKLSKQVDRWKDAYNSFVELTDTDYVVKQSRTVRMPEWVHPLMDDTVLERYSYTAQWTPLYTQQLTVPNYYPRMIAALPRPYRTEPSDASVPITQTTRNGRFQNGASVSGLGNYTRTRGILHEDGTRDIQDLPVPNTTDDLRVKGYVLDARTLALPNPLPDHPFLSTTDARVIETTDPFQEVYPTLEAILTHAMPTTSDPYGEARPFLKLYDVRLSDIPWSAWSVKFPPAEELPRIEIAPSVSFPAPSDTLPSENLRNVYVVPYTAGVHPRAWLMRQEDGGWMVERMLLSRAGDNGRVPVTPLGEVLFPQLPASTPEECLSTTKFDSIVEGGVFRAGTCVPPGVIAQERGDAIFKGRIAWNDDMDATILREHMKLLKACQPTERMRVPKTYAAVPAKGDSELRRQIKTVLQDPRRLPDDKADALDVLLQNIVPADRVFLDPEGGFLLCQHTLAVLRGSMSKDLDAFYRTWTAVDAGVRACMSCGERVGQVYVQAAEFDDDGRLDLHYGAMEEQPTMRGEVHTDALTLGLRELQSTFATDTASEVVLYLMLSILQVLPTNEQLLPVLQTLRKMSASLRKANKGAEYTNRTEGVLGLMGTVLLIQSHLLIPRRTFGARALSMNGFPRDTDVATDKGIVDSLLYVLRTTFEAFPTAFKGVIVPFMRAVLMNTKDVRKDLVAFLAREAPKWKNQLVEAKLRNDASPVAQTDVSVVLPLTYLDKQEYVPTETLPQREEPRTCDAVRPMSMLVPKQPPRVTQTPLTLERVLAPNASAVGLRVTPSKPVARLDMSEPDIRARLKLGMPKDLRLPEVKRFLDETNDGRTIEGMYQRLLDVLALESTFPKEEVRRRQTVPGRIPEGPLYRDTMKGYVYDLLHEIASQANRVGLESALQKALRTDLALRCMLLRKSDAEKEQQALRARERETIKQRLRVMDDTKRELTKTFLDLGIAAYIVTAEDREMFAQEAKRVEPEADPLADPAVPEEGMNANRDYEDDAVPFDGTAREMDVDRGDYGDRAVRDYDDYADAGGMADDGEGYGV